MSSMCNAFITGRDVVEKLKNWKRGEVHAGIVVKQWINADDIFSSRKLRSSGINK